MESESPVSAAEQGREKELSPEKKSFLWDVLRKFVLAGTVVIGASGGFIGGKAIGEYLLEHGKITDVEKNDRKKARAIERPSTWTNLNEIGEGDTVVEDMELKVDDATYYVTIDTGITKKDFAYGGGWEGNPDKFGKMNSVLSKTVAEDGKTTTVLFEVSERGIRQTRKEIGQNGNVEKEEITYLTIERSNFAGKE